MLERCVRDQWKPEELDWSAPPRALSREDEVAIVQLFTNMAGIELLAAALFEEQRRRAKDPRLQRIFATFVADEKRHAEVALRLARHYDVHRYQRYEQDRYLQRFAPHFVRGVRWLADDVANAYITGGELILDIALLRSIDDYVRDGMSAQAMRLINRDESRHIAVDYHMVEYYASPAYDADRSARSAGTFADSLRAAWTFASLLFYAKPFFRAVFFQPMERVDPGCRRMREAFKRMQLLGAKPGVTDRPFSRFLTVLQDAYNHPVLGPVVGTLAARLAGIEPQFLARLYDASEWERARASSFDQLAEEALAVKSS